MNRTGLTFNSRKALMNNIGEAAGTEIANALAEMAAEIEAKVLEHFNLNPAGTAPEGE